MATPSTAPVSSQTRHTTLGRLDEEWACLARCPAARQALRRWAVDDAFAGAESLDEILRRRRDPRRSGAVMTALASRAAHDDVAACTLLQRRAVVQCPSRRRLAQAAPSGSTRSAVTGRCPPVSRRRRHP